jgi:predicted dipeptidase
MKIFILCVVLFVFSCEKSQPETFKSEEIAKILSHFESKEILDFNQFLKQLHNFSENKSIKSAITLYQNKSKLDGNDQINFFRIVSLYSRLKYKDDVLKLLEEMVSIPTDKKEGLNQSENSNIIKFGELVERTANEFGLIYRNIDNKIFEVSLNGTGTETFGIYTHCDVVPANKDYWVLEDGTKLNPYEMKIIDDKIYGRGTEDDKCSIAASLLAMKLLKEIDQVPKRTIRLIIETTEETTQEGFEYYKERNKLPDYNIVLDNSYPIVTAEKGYGLITVSFDTFKGKNKGHEILEVTGGLATNQIAAKSIATVNTKNAKDLIKAVELIKEKFHVTYGNNFSIETEESKNTVKIILEGLSAHSSEPDKAVNPLPRIYLLIHELNKNKIFKENHFILASNYVSDKIGIDYLAKKLGVDYQDDFMGPLTASLTVSEIKSGKLNIITNLRNPRGKSPEQLKNEIISVLKAYQSEWDVPFAYDVLTTDFMYRNPKGKWINTLLNIYGEHTGKESKPISSGGGTTAKQLPEAVSFGPSHPGEKYRGHNANEYKTIENLYLDIQMFTEMLLRIGSLDTMK